MRDNDGRPFDAALFATVRAELTDTFGGVTAYQRTPAVGLWEDDDGDVQRDDVLLFETMAAQLDQGWWRSYRDTLAERFAQDEVLVRAWPCERL